jgi:lysozyme
VWIGLEYDGPGHTARKAIGIHLDANAATAAGSAGCVVLATRAEVEKLIRWLEGGSVNYLYVDWGLKTCPRPKAA